MKKNICILFFLALNTIIFYPAQSTTPIESELARIIDVVHQIRRHLRHENIRENFNILSQPFKDNSATAEINKARQALNKATNALIDLANGKPSSLTTENFATELIQPCLTPLVKNSFTKGALGIFKNPQMLQVINLSTDPIKYQTYDILNRIFVLWHLSSLLFQIPANQKIALQWPNGNFTISEWQNLTGKAANAIWTTTEEVEAQSKKVREETSQEESQAFAKLQEKQFSNLQDRLRKQHLQEESQAFAKLQEEHAKQTQKFKQKEKTTSREQQQFQTIQPSVEQLIQATALLKTFQECRKTHIFHHELFSKNKVENKIIETIQLLSSFIATFAQGDIPSLANMMDTQTIFAEKMNDLYASCFKNKLGGRIGNKFLVMKHTFKVKPDGTRPAPLPEEEAVMFLTDLILLWEIYNTLFKNLDTKDNDHTITLPYFNQESSVAVWLAETGRAGFNQPGQFSEELKTSISICLPEQAQGPSRLSAIVQKIKAGTKIAGTVLQEKAEAAGTWFARKLVDTKRFINKLTGQVTGTFEKVAKEATRKVEEEEDEL